MTTMEADTRARPTIIKQFTIFSDTGHVLWQLEHDSFAGPVNNLIDDVIIQEKSVNTYETSLNSTEYVLKWCRDNFHKIIFVCMYKKILQPQMLYVDDLVQSIQAAFIQLYSEELRGRITSFQFQDTFFEELNKAERSSGFLGRAKPKMRSWGESRKNTGKKKKKKKKQEQPVPSESDQSESADEDEAKQKETKAADDQSEDDNPPADVEEVVEEPVAQAVVVEDEGEALTPEEELKRMEARLKLNRIQARRKGPGGRRKKMSSKKKSAKAGKSPKKKTESTKIKVTRKLMDSLDASNSKRDDLRAGDVVNYEDASEVDADAEAERKGASSWAIPGLSSVTGMLQSLAGQKALTAGDLE